MFLTNTMTKRTFLMNAFASKGVVQDSGTAYDFTELWLMCPRKNPGGGQGLGYEVARWGTSANYDSIKHSFNPLASGPVMVEVELEYVQQGKGDNEKQVPVVSALKFIGPAEGRQPERKAA